MMKHFTLMFFIFCAQMLSAEYTLIEQEYGSKKETKATVTAIFNKLPTSGYMPILVELKNGGKADKTWTLNFTSKGSKNDYRRDDQQSQMTSKFSCSCPAGTSKTYTLIVPIITIIPNQGIDSVNAVLDVSLSSGTASRSRLLESSQYITEPATLVSRSISNHHSHQFDSTLSYSYHSYTRSSSETTSSFEPAQLPSDWRGYVGYDAMICTDKDWKSISSSAKNAILEWNRLGGRLVICTLEAKSDFKSLGINADSTAKNSALRSFGSVKLVPIASIDKIDVAALCTLIRNSSSASVVSKPKAESNLEDFGAMNSTTSYSSGPEWPLQQMIGNKDFNPTFFILILIIFGILVGPVNLFVFAKSGRRHRLFITTPIISLVASALLLLMIIFQDGFGGKGERLQLVEIDPVENKSYVLQEQLVRTGIVLGSSFETSAPTYFTQVPMKESRFSRVTRDSQSGDTNFTAEHGEKGFKTEGDWFQSRSEYGHYLESVIPTRGKLTLKSNGGAPVLSSSFSFSLDKVVYQSKNGEWWMTENLASGDSAKLTKLSHAKALDLIKEKRNTMTRRLAQRFMRLTRRKEHFFALTQDAPGIDTLDSITWKKTHTVLTGAVVK